MLLILARRRSSISHGHGVRCRYFVDGLHVSLALYRCLKQVIYSQKNQFHWEIIDDVWKWELGNWEGRMVGNLRNRWAVTKALVIWHLVLETKPTRAYRFYVWGRLPPFFSAAAQTARLQCERSLQRSEGHAALGKWRSRVRRPGRFPSQKPGPLLAHEWSPSPQRWWRPSTRQESLKAGCRAREAVLVLKVWTINRGVKTLNFFEWYSTHFLVCLQK